MSNVDFVIEHLAVASSLTVDPSMATGTATLSADANATMTMSASDFDSIFFFAGDSIDLDNVAADDIKYAVDSSSWPSITISGASVDEADRANSDAGSDQAIKHDLVRHIAQDVFGVANSADFFNNEAELVSDVANRDSGLKSSFASKLDAAGTKAVPLDNGTNTAANVVKSLIEQMANAGVYDRMTNSDGELLESSNLDETADATSGLKYYNLKFKAGDTIKVKVTYSPASATPLTGAGDIGDHSYTIVITLN
jgi:hypothetical protein